MAQLSYEGIELGAQSGPFKYPLKDRIEQVLQASGNAHPWHHGRSPWGPPVAPPSLLGPICLAFIDSIASVDAGTTLVRQEIETQAALRQDRQPIGYGRFVAKEEDGGNKTAVFEARFRDETGLLIGHVRTTLAFSGSPVDAAAGERKGQLDALTRKVALDELIAVAPALVAAEYISEMMTGVLGKEWFEDAELSLEFPRQVSAGDTLTANGRLVSETAEGAVIRRVYEVWAENQRGEAVAAGAAGSLVMPAR